MGKTTIMRGRWSIYCFVYSEVRTLRRPSVLAFLEGPIVRLCLVHVNDVRPSRFTLTISLHLPSNAGGRHSHVVSFQCHRCDNGWTGLRTARPKERQLCNGKNSQHHCSSPESPGKEVQQHRRSMSRVSTVVGLDTSNMSAWQVEHSTTTPQTEDCTVVVRSGTNIL